jgi:hypothetical protein
VIHLLLAAVAAAGPVRVTQLPFHLRPSPWPDGVKVELVELPAQAVADPDVSFVVSAPTVVGRELVLRGELRNDGADEALVWLFDAPTGGGPFQVELAGPGVSWKPVPVDGPGQPEVYPMARVVHVPPRTALPYEVALHLAQFSWPKGAAATVSWSFQTMPAPAKGTAAVTLP